MKTLQVCASRVPILMRSLPRVKTWAGLLLMGMAICWVAGAPALHAAAAASNAGGPPGPPKLLRITPTGDDVPAGQQIVFEFDRPIAPLGRMERESFEIPIAIEPAAACQWRWLNPATLSCQLPEKEPLLPATRYQVSVKPEVTAESGARLPGAVQHTFLTQRPVVKNSSFRSWLSPGEPQLIVWLDQPVDRASASEHIYFWVAGGQRARASVSEDPQFQESSAYRKGQVWLIQPESPLPADQPVALHVEPGIVPLGGREPGAQRQALARFHTHGAFRLVGVECQDLSGKAFTRAAGPDAPIPRRCSPTQPISLLFSAPPQGEGLRQHIQVTPDLADGKADEDPWEDTYVDTSLFREHQKTETYSITLPWERMKPYTEYRVDVRAGGLRDVFGRGLEADGALRFATDHHPPDLTLFRDMPVLEKSLDTDLPVVTTNLKKLKARYRTAFPGRKSPPLTRTFDLPSLPDKAVAFHLGLRKMVGKPSGVVQGQVTSEPVVRREEDTGGTFFAQITPFHVHVKYGHHNTLVWITDLASGAPVPGVQLEMHEDTFSTFHEQPRVLARGMTGEEGVGMLPGTSALDPGLKLLGGYGAEEKQLFLWCRKGDDLAVLPFSYAFQVSSEGANREYIPEWMRPRHGHLRAWGTTAQGIYRGGDTVQYKIYVRDQDNRRFVAPPGVPGGTGQTEGSWTYQLKVVDPQEKIVHEAGEIRLSAFGAFDGSFPLARTAAVGWYRFVLTPSFAVGEELESMRVLVSDFTPSSFKVATELNGAMFSLGDSVTVSTQATMHAGGPYARAGTRVTARIETQPFAPGTAVTRGFDFDVVEHSTDDSHVPEIQSIFQAENSLNDQGGLETTFRIPDNPVIHGKLVVESAVKDERGKRVAHRVTAGYAGREHYVGLSQGDWILEEKKPAPARVVVVNRAGEAVAGAPVRVAVERQETRVAQVKGAGKAYVPQYSTRWVAEESLELTSGEEPVAFTFTPRQAGVYRLRARVGNVPEFPMEEGVAIPEPEVDTASSAQASADQSSQAPSTPEASEVSAAASGDPRGHQTILRRYVVGKGHVVWESVAGNVLNVVPDKTTYRTGDTARFLVQNPFPGCAALVTIERFGVMQSWVRTLASSSEIIEIPIVPDHLPGFYLSVLVVSPRVDKPMSEEGEDLGKPTFRLGYAEVPVKDSAKEVTVTVKPDREEYKPGETVTLDLQATVGDAPAGGERPPVELAVAVLDEAIFALLPGRKVFDPYEGFYRLESLDLSNYNLIMQLVGRQKLEKKGASPGGGGGPDLGMRSDFRFVAHWSPSVPTDADGRARIQFKLPESLTGWRALALAVTPEDRMGLGENVFRVNKPTEIRPALPNRLVDGDRVEARFTVMNRTDRSRTLDVILEARGAVAGEVATPRPASGGGDSPGSMPPNVAPGPASPLDSEEGVRISRSQLTLAPFGRQVVTLPVQARGHGAIQLMAQAGDDADRDAMTVSLPVGRRQTLHVVATHGMVRGAQATEDVHFPGDMNAETGRLRWLLSPTVLGGLEGTFEYMRDFPHPCWEQILSKGLMAAFYGELKPYVDPGFEWAESQDLPARTVARAAEFQDASGGMCYFVPRLENVDPYLSAFTALALEWLRERGHVPPPAVEEGLEKYLQTFLRHDPPMDPHSRSMSATVRAVALLALAGRGRLSREELERFESHVPEMSLFGKALYLQALTRVAGTEMARKEALRQILAQADHSPSGVVFRETLDPRVRSLLLSSTVRDHGAILSALLAYEASQGEGRSELGALPRRLAHGIVQGRKSRRHWRSTQENLFAVKALIDFSRTFERDRGPMTVRTWLDDLQLGSGDFKERSSPPLALEYRTRPEDPGRKARARLAMTGDGLLYHSLALLYETPVVEPRDPSEGPAVGSPSAEGALAGLEVHREYSVERDGQWVLMHGASDVRLGDLVRVDLFVSTQAERYFVVLDDPIPGGMEPVNRDLATASLADVEKGRLPLPQGSYGEQFQEWRRFSSSRLAFYHRELRHDGARFYSEVLPAGRYHLTYVAQAVAPGLFTALPPRAEEMYNPEVFGKGLPASLRVDPAP
ncbi:MAG: MG2 domain-containing protein [Syntrophobacteraceae bacterium]|nr:MG2 domain-containing protein [Syntrophobacteraceae bacterium]